MICSKKFITLLFVFILFHPLSVDTESFGLMSSDPIWFSKEKFFDGDEVKIYTAVVNNQFDTFSGKVVFYRNGVELGSVRSGEISYEKVEQVGITIVAVKGNQSFGVEVVDMRAKKGGEELDLSGQSIATRTMDSIFIDIDTDRDGIGNKEDPDDDGDGLSDVDELSAGTNSLVADTDGDGLYDGDEVVRGLNPNRSDTDGDGYMDGEDKFPLDAGEYTDFDGDGIGDNSDVDDDNDGISDILEVRMGTNPYHSDTDGDGLYDGDEMKKGTDPLNMDTDGDGYSDSVDAFPLDPNEYVDTDGDGVGDNTDDDDDGDSLSDEMELQILGTDPLKKDTDGDGLDDDEEVSRGTDPLNPDTDNDGKLDGDDDRPLKYNPTHKRRLYDIIRRKETLYFSLGIAVFCILYRFYRKIFPKK